MINNNRYDRTFSRAYFRREYGKLWKTMWKQSRLNTEKPQMVDMKPIKKSWFTKLKAWLRIFFYGK